MIKLIISSILLIMLGCSTSELPHSFVHVINDRDYKVVGKFHKLEYDDIIQVVKTHPTTRLNFYVTSIGGNSEDLLEAMDAVYYHGNVHWYTVGYCESACGIMALATRHGNGKIGLHSFYSTRRGHHYPAPEYNKIVLDKLKSYGYDLDKLSPMFDSIEKMSTVTLVDGRIVEE